jgi:hypothetical protein
LETEANVPEQADTNPDRHPTPDELLDYHVGETSLEQRESIQEHLARCPMCVRTVLDLAAFPNLPVPGSEERLSSDEISAEWERFRERVGHFRPPGVWRTLGSIPLPWKLAAALFITCLGLSLQTVRLQRKMGDLSRPRGGVELVDLSPVDGKVERAEGGTEGFRPLPWADRLVLLLNLADVRSFPEYEAEITAADGHEVWRGGIRQTPDGTFALEVPRRFLPSSSYHIRLFGFGPQGRIPVAEYSLVLRD